MAQKYYRLRYLPLFYVDERFMKEAVELMRLGSGMPAFNSDEVIIPSLMEKGVSKEDAYNYSAIGCVEVAVPGRCGYRCTGMSFLNYPKTLLIAMNDGTDPKSGSHLMEGAGKFTEYTSFDELMAAWDKTITQFTREQVAIDAAVDRTLELNTMDVLCSALVDDCIDRGLSLKEGGAVYDMVSDLQVGIANLADSLSAIRKCVFEDRLVTPPELWAAMMDNYEGAQGERVRRIMGDIPPRFGNDGDYVDLLIREAYDMHIREIKSTITQDLAEDLAAVATMQGHHPYRPMSDRGSEPWRPLTEERLESLWQRAVPHATMPTRTDQLPYSNQ